MISSCPPSHCGLASSLRVKRAWALSSNAQARVSPLSAAMMRTGVVCLTPSEALPILFRTNVSDRDVGPDTISDTFRARTQHHHHTLKMK